jgi:hypothetical protein
MKPLDYFICLYGLYCLYKGFLQFSVDETLNILCNGEPHKIGGKYLFKVFICVIVLLWRIWG